MSIAGVYICSSSCTCLFTVNEHIIRVVASHVDMFACHAQLCLFTTQLAPILRLHSPPWTTHPCAATASLCSQGGNGPLSRQWEWRMTSTTNVQEAERQGQQMARMTNDGDNLQWGRRMTRTTNGGNDEWQRQPMVRTTNDGTTNDRDNKQWGQQTMNNGNNKQWWTTNNGERQTAGYDHWRGTKNGGEQWMTGSSKQQGTTNSREQQTVRNNKQTAAGPPTLATNARWWGYFLFLFQIFILVTPHCCEQLLAGCLCIYLFCIHNQIKLIVPKKWGENQSKPVFWTITELIEPVLIGSVTV